MMNNRRLALYIVIFCICLVCGLFVGSTVIQRDQNDGQPIADLLLRNPTPATGQQNYLVIGVERFDTNSPVVTGIWMILYHPDFPKISLIPLFPQASNTPLDLILDVSSEFTLDEQGLPTEALFDKLTEANYWWSGYVLMDQFAMIAITDSAGGVDLGNGTISGAIAIGNIPVASNDPDGALIAQATLLSDLCTLILKHDPLINADELMSLFPRHIRSDSTPLELKSIWQEIISGDAQFSCAFPTIDVQIP